MFLDRYFFLSSFINRAYQFSMKTQLSRPEITYKSEIAGSFISGKKQQQICILGDFYKQECILKNKDIDTASNMC